MVADGRPGDRLFLWEPLCHVGGAQMLLAPFLEDVQLHVYPGFSASRFWQQVVQSGATQLHYLGGVLEILLQQPREAIPPHALRIAWGGGLNPHSWNIVRETFGVEKTSEGLQAIRWFREGKLMKIAEYCCFDVKLTKMVHDYGTAHGQIYFTNKFGKKITVPVKW